MDILKKQYKKIMTRIQAVFSLSIYTKSGIRPAYDWQMTLTSFFISFLIVFIIALYLYVRIINGLFIQQNISTQSDPVYSINEKSLSFVTSYFGQKAVDLQNIQTSTTTVADPSK